MVKPRLQRDVGSKYARLDPEIFDNVESAYEALGHGPSSIGSLRNKQTKSFAAQVDFPDGCNLLVYQCVKQLRNALAAKDEEIKHLRLLVHHLRFTHFCNLPTKVFEIHKQIEQGPLVRICIKTSVNKFNYILRLYEGDNRKCPESLDPHFT